MAQVIPLSVLSPCFAHSKFDPLCSSQLNLEPSKFVGLCDSCTSMLENN